MVTSRWGSYNEVDVGSIENLKHLNYNNNKIENGNLITKKSISTEIFFKNVNIC